MTANIGFGLFILAVALVLFGMGWRMLRNDKESTRLAAASGSWLTTPGVVGEVRIDRQEARSYDRANNVEITNTTYAPKVDYTYAVAGQQYAGTRINFLQPHYARESKAEAVIAPYSAGGTVTVAYDPADPQTSVLDRDTRPPSLSFWTGFILAIAALVLLLGFAMFFIPI